MIYTKINGVLATIESIVDEDGLEYEKTTLLGTPQPTEQDDMNSMLVDHEYRLTLLELGLTE